MFFMTKLVRRGMFLAAAAASLAWLVWGFRWSQDWTASWSRPKATETERLIGELASRDAKAAHELESLAARSDARALGAVLVDADRRGGLEAVRNAATASSGGAKPAALRLAELAVNVQLNVDREQRDGVLLAHGPTVEVLSGADVGVNDYLDQLERASKDASVWSVVRDDPVGLVVWTTVKNRRLFDYYSRERDWLAPALAESSKDDASLTQGLQSAKDYHPLLKQAIVDLNLGRAGFELFREHGALVQSAVVANRIPLEEVLEVVFANRDLVGARRKSGTPVEVAEWLARVRANKPQVWMYARTTPLALRLEEQAPDVAESLLRRFGVDDVAAFVFVGYESEAPTAARAIDRFGDLGIYILNRYRDDPRVHRLLADDSVGVRIVPFLAQFGDKGLDRVSADRAWLDKYIGADGSPLEKEWWTKIPFGGAADVARNWATGKPNEWSELGWGAVDAADAALLVASFGASSVVTQGGKAAAKRAVLAEATEGGARFAVGARLAAREAMAAGRSASLLRRAAAAVHSGAVAAARTTLRAGEHAASLVRTASGGWTGMSPLARKWTARALLGAGLFVTLKERTLPMVADKAGALLEKIARQPLESLGAGLRNALAALTGIDPAAMGTAVGIGMYAAVLGSLCAATWLLRPRRRKVVYV
jgi:hypothetical protein